MLDQLIAKIAAQTGQPVETVAPVVGALLAHLGDVLPAPIAHQIAIFLGIHQEAGAGGAAAPEAVPSPGGLLGGLASSFGGAGGQSNAGAAALINVAESLLAGLMAGRR